MNTIILQTQNLTTVHKAADEFVKLDPYGVGMALIAMTVVFVVLAIIYLIYKNIAKFMQRQAERKIEKMGIKAQATVTNSMESPAEIGAAISMAMHLYAAAQQDLDSLTLTIQKVSKMYSPWSSKIYTLTQLPR